MDEADVGNERAEKILSDRLAVRKQEGPEATGECLDCGASLPEGRRWCNSDCRDLWQREQRRKL